MTVECVWSCSCQISSIKNFIYALLESNVINMYCLITSFCMSCVVIKSAAVEINRFVSAWNLHLITGN